MPISYVMSKTCENLIALFNYVIDGVYAIVRPIPPLTQQFSHVAVPLSSSASASEPRTNETIVSLSSVEDNADVQLSRELAAAQVDALSISDKVEEYVSDRTKSHH